MNVNYICYYETKNKLAIQRLIKLTELNHQLRGKFAIMLT